jgi:hypothetical protein
MFEKILSFFEKTDNQILIFSVIVLSFVVAGNFLQWNLNTIFQVILYVFFGIFLLLVIITTLLLIKNFVSGNKTPDN